MAVVMDNARLLKALAGTDGIDERQLFDAPSPSAVPNYPEILSSLAASAEPSSFASGLKVGILREGFAAPGVDPQLAAAVHKAAQRFSEIGATVEEVSIPMHKLGPAVWTCSTRTGIAMNGIQGHSYGRKGYHTSRLAEEQGRLFSTTEAAAQEAYERIGAKNPAAVNALLGGMYLHQKYPGLAGKAINHVRQLRDTYEKAFVDGGFDVLITPVTPTVAMRHPKQDEGPLDKIKYAVGSTVNTCPFNSSGHPALSLPVSRIPVADEEGKSSGLRMPVGMQVVGRLWDEASVYKAAFAWESNFNWKEL